MSKEAVRDGNAGVRIADGLREAILRGELAPGSRIRQEDVAEQYAASRVPVRNALRILEGERLVTLVANAGAWVSRFGLAECEEIYQLRERLEPLLLRYSYPGLTAQTIATISDLAAEMEQAPDIDELLRLDRKFHLTTYSGAETVILGDTVERAWNATHHYRRAFTELLDDAGMRTVHSEHRMLVDAIRIGDVDQAELVLRGHISRTRLRLARHPELFK